MICLNKPVLSITSSLLALLCGSVVMVSGRYWPEELSIQVFFVLFPATLVLAILGYLLGARPTASKYAPLSTVGFLISGGILLTIALTFLRPAF